MITPDFDLLYDYITELTQCGYRLAALSEEMSMQEGLLAAIDSSFDESIYQLGKSLQNDGMRKLHKEMLRRNHPSYSDAMIKLDQLKRDKAELLVQKEQTRQLLSVGKLQVKSSLLDREIKSLLISDL